LRVFGAALMFSPISAPNVLKKFLRGMLFTIMFSFKVPEIRQKATNLMLCEKLEFFKK